MEIKIVKGKKEQVVASERGDTILKLLERAGHAVRTPCGGKGKCGRCLVRVEDTLAKPGKKEEGLLADRRADEGMRVACLARVDQPMTIVLDGGKKARNRPERSNPEAGTTETRTTKSGKTMKGAPVTGTMEAVTRKAVKSAAAGTAAIKSSESVRILPRTLGIALVCASEHLLLSLLSGRDGEVRATLSLPFNGPLSGEKLADAVGALVGQAGVTRGEIGEIVLALEPLQLSQLTARAAVPEDEAAGGRRGKKTQAPNPVETVLPGLEQAALVVVSPGVAGDLSAMPLHVLLSLSASGIHRHRSAHLLEWPEWFHIVAANGRLHAAADAVPLQRLLRKAGIGLKSVRKVHEVTDPHEILRLGCERLVGHPKRIDHLSEAVRKIEWVV